jgi:hypothetical protein
MECGSREAIGITQGLSAVHEKWSPLIAVFVVPFASKVRRLITQSVVDTLTALVFGPATLCFSGAHRAPGGAAGTKVKDNPRNN